jgi:hypothetical protein
MDGRFAHEFIGSEALDGRFAHEFVGSGAMDSRFGHQHGTDKRADNAPPGGHALLQVRCKCCTTWLRFSIVMMHDCRFPILRYETDQFANMVLASSSSSHSASTRHTCFISMASRPLHQQLRNACMGESSPRRSATTDFEWMHLNAKPSHTCCSCCNPISSTHSY